MNSKTVKKDLIIAGLKMLFTIRNILTVLFIFFASTILAIAYFCIVHIIKAPAFIEVGGTTLVWMGTECLLAIPFIKRLQSEAEKLDTIPSIIER